MQLQQAIPAFLAALLVAGCSSTPEKALTDRPPMNEKMEVAKTDRPPMNEKMEVAKKNLTACLDGITYKELSRSCPSVTLSELPPESKAQATEKWAAFLTEKGPDYQLFAAIELRDVEAVKDALNNGANPNRTFEYDSERTPLWVATIGRWNLEIAKVLLEAGADPNWSYGPKGKEGDIVSNAVGRTNYINNKIIYGTEIAYLLIEYGYIPPDSVLKSMSGFLERNHFGETRARVEPLYEKLRQISAKGSKGQVAAENSKAKDYCEMYQEIAQDFEHLYPMDLGGGQRRFLDLLNYNSKQDVCEITLRYEMPAEFWVEVFMTADDRYDAPLARKFIEHEDGRSAMGGLLADSLTPDFKNLDSPEVKVTLQLQFTNGALETLRVPMYQD